MSKASKVSHFHSTTYSAHRGGVAHATLGRPMIPTAHPTRPGVVGAISDSTSLTSKDRWVASCVGETVNYGYTKYSSKCNKPGSVGSVSLFSWDDDGQVRALFIYNGMDGQQVRNLFLPFGGDSFYNGPDMSKKFRFLQQTPWSEWKIVGVPASVAMAFAKNYGIPTNFKQENVDTNTQIVTGTSPCPPNQHRNASNTACECDQGYTKNAAGNCVAMDYYGTTRDTPPVKVACPRGWVRNAQGKCVRIPSTAPQTQHRKNVFQQPFDRPGKIHGDLIDGTVGDFIDDAGEWVSTVVQESQNAFSNPDVGAGYQPPSANPGDNQNAAEQCAQMGPGWSWSADRNACANFEQEAAACAAAGNTWDDVAGQCRSNNCPPGSHSNPDLPGCIPDKLPCGAHSFQSGDKCLCEQGFEFKDMVSLECVPVGQGWQSAIKKCGENTHTDPNVGGCVCDPGYIFDPKRTTADTLVCGKAECGSNSVFNQQDGQCHCKPGYDWVDPANIDNLDCKKAGGNGGGPVAPPAPKCGPGTHVDSATNACVVDETAQVEPTKAEDNTWKWVAGIAAAAVVVGGGTYLATRKEKKGQKGALRAKLSSHSTQIDVG